MSFNINISDNQHAQVSANIGNIGIGFLFGNIDGEGKYEGSIFNEEEAAKLKNIARFGFDSMVNIFVGDASGVIDYMEEDATDEETGAEQHEKTVGEENHAEDEMKSEQVFHTTKLADENAQLDEGYDDEDRDVDEKISATEQ